MRYFHQSTGEPRFIEAEVGSTPHPNFVDLSGVHLVADVELLNDREVVGAVGVVTGAGAVDAGHGQRQASEAWLCHTVLRHVLQVIVVRHAGVAPWLDEARAIRALHGS